MCGSSKLYGVGSGVGVTSNVLRRPLHTVDQCTLLYTVNILKYHKIQSLQTCSTFASTHSKNLTKIYVLANSNFGKGNWVTHGAPAPLNLKYL